MRYNTLFWTGIPLTLSAILGGFLTAVFVTEISHTSKNLPSMVVMAAEGIKEKKTITITPLSQEEWKIFDAGKEQLLRSTLTLTLPEDLALTQTVWNVPLIEHPEWIIWTHTELGVRATLDERGVKLFLEEEVIPKIPAASDLLILALPEGKELRAEIEGDLHDGWKISVPSTVRLIAQNVAAGLLTIELPIQEVKGEIRNETAVDIGEMRLLSRGRSNFAGSVPNRIFNIKKALSEHIAHVMVAPGETFYFNATLGEAVEEYTGWRTSLGIFNGEDLQPTPGGGICQISTTVYRAAVAAGLPMEEQRNHSIYIKYYRQYGEGLDATIFLNSQDLTFRNDTANYLLFRAYHEGEDAVVEIYGTPDGRTVALEGPYRRHDAPDDVLNPEHTWGLGWNDIGWRQTITRADGTEEKNILISRYRKEIPWNPPEEEYSVTLHSAASN